MELFTDRKSRKVRRAIANITEVETVLLDVFVVLSWKIAHFLQKNISRLMIHSSHSSEERSALQMLFWKLFMQLRELIFQAVLVSLTRERPLLWDL